MSNKVRVSTKLNGVTSEFLCETRQSLLEVLRDTLNLTGAKEGCNNGNCGACNVILNGVLVQNHVEIQGTTEYIGLPKNVAHGPAPLRLQDHGDPVSFRNVWIREL